jgi:hypothetical protein
MYAHNAYCIFGMKYGYMHVKVRRGYVPLACLFYSVYTTHTYIHIHIKARRRYVPLACLFYSVEILHFPVTTKRVKIGMQ